MRSDDPRFSDLDSFLRHAADTRNTPLRIARFASDPSRLGLERLLLDRFGNA